MGHRTFSMITGVLFALITLLHVCRLAFSWQVTVDSAVIPMWVSWIAIPVGAFLAYQSFKFAGSAK